MRTTNESYNTGKDDEILNDVAEIHSNLLSSDDECSDKQVNDFFSYTIMFDFIILKLNLCYKFRQRHKLNYYAYLLTLM